MPAMWIFLDFWQRQFVPLAMISIFICSENRKGKKSKSGASFKLEKCKYKIQAPQIRKKVKQEIREWKEVQIQKKHKKYRRSNVRNRGVE